MHMSTIERKSQRRNLQEAISPAMGYKGNFKCNKCLFSSDKPGVIRDHVEKVHAGEFQTNRDDCKVPTPKADFNYQPINAKTFRHINFHAGVRVLQLN